MATIRIFTENDVPAVAALFARVYPAHRWSSQLACESYFREILFDNPWRDPELPSWVADCDAEKFIRLRVAAGAGRRLAGWCGGGARSPRPALRPGAVGQALLVAHGW